MEPFSADRAKKKRYKFFRVNSLDHDIKVVGFFSIEGLPITSIFQGVNETDIAVMSATFHSLAESVINEVKNGDFEGVYIKTTDGYLIIIPIIKFDLKLIAILSTTSSVNLNSISAVDLRRMVEEAINKRGSMF